MGKSYCPMLNVLPCLQATWRGWYSMCQPLHRRMLSFGSISLTRDKLFSNIIRVAGETPSATGHTFPQSISVRQSFSAIIVYTKFYAIHDSLIWNSVKKFLAVNFLLSHNVFHRKHLSSAYANKCQIRRQQWSCDVIFTFKSSGEFQISTSNF